MTKRSRAWSGVLTLGLLSACLCVALGDDKPKAKKKANPPATSTDSPSTETPAKEDASPKKDEATANDESASRKVDFSGNWTWKFEAPNGFVYEPTLKIKQKGSKIAGTVYGKRGGSLPVRSVRVTKDSQVAFTLDREFYNYPMEVKFIGKLEGDSITGKMGVFVNGNSRVFDWTARRLKEDGTRPAETSRTMTPRP